MTDKPSKPWNWKLPLIGALAALAICLPQVISGNELGPFLLSALVTLVIGIVLLVAFLRTVRCQPLAALSMGVLFAISLAISWKTAGDIRRTGRWFLEAKEYKAEVLAQPTPPPNELKHVEWEGWGFAGAGDTVVYLVHDPTDALAAASSTHAPGKYSGLPCTVYGVHRLEKNWYTVQFYTDTDWTHCDS